MRVLVVTVVHHPLDARVYAREIVALLDAGHDVTYAAPWKAHAVEPPAGVQALELPRASRRSRFSALRAARRLLAAQGPLHDVVLIHNPELLLALPGLDLPATVWDVHEDLAASLEDKTYLPAPLRRPLSWAVAGAERRAERSIHLLLAEHGYQPRFQRPHPVVPNEPVVPVTVPPSAGGRIVYLGRVSHGRGGAELVSIGERLPTNATLEIMGWAEPEIAAALQAAESAGRLRWLGRMSNDEALTRLEGATAGLSLLHDLPNYRHSRPTKIVEYMARGIPVISTPSPVAVEILEEHDCGIIVPFGDVDAAMEAIERLSDDAELRERLGRNGHRAALEHFNWAVSGPRFVTQLEEWAQA